MERRQRPAGGFNGRCSCCCCCSARARPPRASALLSGVWRPQSLPHRYLQGGHVETPDLFTSHREAAVPPLALFALPASSLELGEVSSSSPQDRKGRRFAPLLLSAFSLPGFQERRLVPLLFLVSRRSGFQALLGGLFGKAGILPERRLA